MVMQDIIQYVNKLPEHSIYWIHGKEGVYINYTSNLKYSFGKVCELYYKLGGTAFEFLECPDDKVYKLIAAEIQRKKLLDKGYKIINQSIPFIQFKAQVRIDSDKDKVLVYLITARRKTEVVGIFRTMQEAYAFVEEFYGCINKGGAACPIVYANNTETRKYWQLKVYKHTMWGGTISPVESSIVNATQTREIV